MRTTPITCLTGPTLLSDRVDMDYDELVALFKPDQYGFCRVKRNGKVEGFWFDTVVKVNDIIKEASDGATD